MKDLRTLSINKLQQNKVTISKGYHLDDPEQWSDVKQIPKEIEDKVKSLYLEGYEISTAKSMLPDEYKWAAEFMAMYHESFYQGRHGLYS